MSDNHIAELTAALEHRQRQIDAMRRTADVLFTKHSPEEMLRETLSVAIEVLRADGGSVLLHNAEREVLIFRYVYGPGADKLIGFELPVTQGVAGKVFRSGVPDRIDNVRERDEHHSLDERTGVQVDSLMSAPLKRAGASAFGVINVINAQERFDDRDLEVLEVLAAVASSAIENARLAEDARKAEIVNLIGDVSHDVKNMLTPIQSGVMTLQPMLGDMVMELEELRRTCPLGETWGDSIGQSTETVAEVYDWILQAAYDASERVQTRVREIADAVKGEIAPPDFRETQVNHAVIEVVQALRSVAHKAGVELKIECDEQLPTAELDGKQIYNALYNLVNNALPETPAGGSVTIRTRTHGDEKIQLEVADTGRGIPDHVRARLFTKDAISTKAGGTGLGTKIVGDIVARHGGTIEVQSQPSQGSTFLITLPRRQTTGA